MLNSLRPHLARAGLIASRLGLERAQASVATLQAIGLPGAVLTRSGKVVASNAGFDTLQPGIVAVAGGSVAIRAPKANTLYRDALDRLAAGARPLAQSIPIACDEDGSPAVLHLLPIHRAARDVFDGAATLLVATLVGERSLPDLAVLASLFDLTPTEARLAADLVTGSTVTDYASASGSSVATARTHLSNVFAKTGTDRQADLIALLSSVKSY